MIAGLDSSLVAPSAAQATAARAAGVSLWSGYLTTHSGVGILASWTQDAFDKARLAGATPIGFCSGWDDPVKIRALAAAWNVRPCLDVEDGIRPDGTWVSGWLDASGAGLYGNYSVHYHPGEPVGRGAAFNVGAAYPGFDPLATWPGYLPRPPRACGWQWQGTHQEFGVPVDRGWYDDWFLSGRPFETYTTGGGSSSMVTITGADGRIHRLIVEDTGETDAQGSRGGPVAWAAFVGGTGGIDAWQGGDGELPGGGGWVAAGTLAATLWTWPVAPLAGGGTGPRELLIVHGRGLDSQLWRKALFTDDFTVQAPWARAAGPAPAIPGQAPLPGPPGPVGPAGPAMDEAQVRALAADEIERRLANG